MNNNLYIMIGIPGSGKSTFVMEHLDSNTKWVSRDTIRKEFNNDINFSREKEKRVFEAYCQQIANYLKKGYSVFADATQISAISRRRLIANIRNYIDITANIIAVYIDTPLDIAIKNNNLREGVAKVPITVIEDFYNKLEPPQNNEGFYKILHVKLIYNKGDNQ